MSRKYKFYDPEGIYFISFSVVKWIEVFTINEYKEIVLDSWRYCMKNKGLVIYAWCIMPDHIHMIIASNKNKLEDIVRDMKSFTSNQLKKAIIENLMKSEKAGCLRLCTMQGC